MMCMNCGCGMPNERHGNSSNITAEDLRRAGEANGQTFEETVRNITLTSRRMREEGESRGGREGSQPRST